MKTIAIILSLFLLINIANGQREDSSYQLPYNSVNIELCGNSYLYGSLNYERIVFHHNDIYLSGRLGIGYIYFYNAIVFSTPILFNFIYHVHKVVSLEGGVGTTLFFQDTKDPADAGIDPVLTGNIGLRLQWKKGFCLRIGFVPYYDFLVKGPNFFSTQFVPWGGLSLGYSFGKK